MPIASARAGRRGNAGGRRFVVSGHRSASVGQRVRKRWSADASAGLTEEGHGVHAEDGAAEVDLAEGCYGTRDAGE